MERGGRLTETQWSTGIGNCELLERLPDEKQGTNNQAGQPRGVEADSFYGVRAYEGGKIIAEVAISEDYGAIRLYGETVEEAAKIKTRNAA